MERKVGTMLDFGDYVCETFDSLAEFADYAEHRNKQNTIFERTAQTDLALARKGWAEKMPAAMEVAEHAVKTLEREGLLPRPAVPVWDVSGAEVDIARFLSGEPENMIEFPPVPRKQPTNAIVLVKSYTTVASVSGATIEKLGMLCMSLALALERLQVPIEVWVDRPLKNCRYWGSDYEYYIQRFPVKLAADWADAGAMMFALVHEGMLRTLGFNVQHSATPRNRTAEEQEFYGDGAILIETIPGGVQPADFIRKELKKQGLLPE